VASVGKTATTGWVGRIWCGERFDEADVELEAELDRDRARWKAVYPKGVVFTFPPRWRS
jgi:hypothetical protein